MAKIFYDHLVAIDELVIELDSLDAVARQEIINLMDETLHHHVLDTILTHLPQEHHTAFLERFHRSPHDPELLIFLKQYMVIDIENEIRKTSQKIKRNLLSAVKKSKHTSLR
ncbi:hypothetical protein HYV22_01400 [Candidatus Gottesmanbacteria bacterium]|nr:hypothetical protein [Candidatus Gottesmanbacteria bacterium]